MANLFNQYFTGIADKLNANKYGSNPPAESGFKKYLGKRVCNSMNLKEFNHLEISNIIKDFDNNKCSDICVRAIKALKY